MAKSKSVSLKGVVREIDKVKAKLTKAKKKATPRGREKLALALNDLNSIRKETIVVCHGSQFVYNVTIPQGS